MGLARSTFYDEPEVQLVEEAWLVERISEVCAEWPAYGYRRVTAGLRGEGRLVNHKKVMRLMKENGLTVRGHAGGSLQRPTATTTGRSSRTLPKILAPSLPSTASRVRWVDAATHTTTPRPRAS